MNGAGGEDSTRGSERSLRVAIVGPYPAEEGKPRNGVESVTSALANGLAERGVTTFVVTSVRGLKAPATYVNRAGVSVHRIPLFDKLGNLTGYAADVHRIRAALNEIAPDIVHIHKVLIYARAALEFKWPSVITIHGIHHLVAAFTGGLAGLRGRFASRYEREAVQRAKHVVCLNRYTAESYGDLLRAEDVRIIDNPVDARYFEAVGDEKPGRMLFGGLICDLKNVLGLLRAVEIVARDHPDCLLRVAGRVGDATYYERCRDFVREHGLEKNVEFVGMIPAEQMAKEIVESSIVVLPSKQETAPVIVSEAMAVGRPVVATPAGGTAEMVDDGVTGLIVPMDDHEALALALGRLLDDAGLRAQMGHAGRAAADRRFRLSVVVDKTLAMYQDILGGL